MGEETKRTINALPGWVTAAVAIGTILFAGGSMFDRVSISHETNLRQEHEISSLQREVAVIRENAKTTSDNIKDIKNDIRDIKNELKARP